MLDGKLFDIIGDKKFVLEGSLDWLYQVILDGRELDYGLVLGGFF